MNYKVRVNKIEPLFIMTNLKTGRRYFIKSCAYNTLMRIARGEAIMPPPPSTITSTGAAGLCGGSRVMHDQEHLQ